MPTNLSFFQKELFFICLSVYKLPSQEAPHV